MQARPCEKTRSFSGSDERSPCPQTKPSKETKPVWLITGCSTGFGRELAKVLLARGYRAVVTARDPTKVADLVEGHAETALALALDVEKQPQIEAAVEAARRKFGRIDVLVNNAGYGYLAAIEEGDDADIRAMFETNVFGLAAMTRAVLPIMRAQKSGAIVNISSMGGFIGFPGSGYYAATKFAVEGLSESLSKEARRSASRSSSSNPAPSAPTGRVARSRPPSIRSTPTPRRRSHAGSRPRGTAARSPATPCARPRRSSPRWSRRTRR